MLQVRAVLGCPPARGRSPSASRPGQATVHRLLAGMVLAAQLGCFVSCPGFVEISVCPRSSFSASHTRKSASASRHHAGPYRPSPLVRVGAVARAQRGEVVLDDREGEFGWSVAEGADHVDHEPVDQGLEPGRLAFGVDVRWQLAAADRLGDAHDQWVVKLAPDVFGHGGEGRVGRGTGDEGQPDQRLLAPCGVQGQQLGQDRAQGMTEGKGSVVGGSRR
jgi:hypothetical protein